MAHGVYTASIKLCMNAICKYSPQPVLERLITYSETIRYIYTLCLKKGTPTLLIVTLERIIGF